MEKTKVSVVFVTINNYKNARELSLKLIKHKLAACVNILKLEKSIYIWKNKIHEDKEVQMVIKTQSGLITKLEQFIQSNHPYSIPEIISLNVHTVNKLYGDWVESVTSPDTQRR